MPGSAFAFEADRSTIQAAWAETSRTPAGCRMLHYLNQFGITIQKLFPLGRAERITSRNCDTGNVDWRWQLRLRDHDRCDVEFRLDAVYLWYRSGGYVPGPPGAAVKMVPLFMIDHMPGGHQAILLYTPDLADRLTGTETCYVKADCFPYGPGPGISRTVVLYITPTNDNCDSARNKKLELEYSDDDGFWTGSIALRGGTLDFKFECDPDVEDPTAPGKFKLSWSGCSTGFLQGGAGCLDPLAIQFGMATIFDDCCDCNTSPSEGPITDLPPELSFFLVGNCRKVAWGRHVDYTPTGIPIVAKDRPCEFDKLKPGPCAMTCPLIATITGEGDCACMSGEYGLDYLLVGWQYQGGWPGCLASGQMDLSCSDEGAGSGTELEAGHIRLCLRVVCGTTNTGADCIVIPADELENLDVEFLISMTDPEARPCTGECVYQYNEMAAVWTLHHETCDPPVGFGCNDCGETPSDPPADPVDGQIVSRPCQGEGEPAPCCIGGIHVRLTRPGGTGAPMRLAVVPSALPPAGQPCQCGGPGTELKALLKSLGLTPLEGCKCNKRARQMDQWGVAGCREHREEILTWLRKEQKKRNWMEKLVAGVAAVKQGLILNPLDPAAGLLDEAIKRAGSAC